ncbi:MAG: ABC transporter permease [bacterium]|nr:ABC transporter permease [bacterium]
MHDLLMDVKYALRKLRSNPGFTTAAVVCIALGIGANTATFSIADALLFRSSSFTEPNRIVRLFINWSSGLEHASFSYPDFVDLAERNDVYEGLVAEALRPFHLSTGENNERVWGSIVSGNYFSLLGVNLSLGRGFSAEEDSTPGTHPVTVLSYGLWQSRFAGASDIVGSEIALNGRTFTVIGVTEEGYLGSNSGIATALWVPMMMQRELLPGNDLLNMRGSHWISPVIGRLKPGVTPEQALAASNAVMAGLTEEFPDSNEGKTIELFADAESSLHPMVRGGFTGFMALVFVVVGFILVLACANIAGLLLSRFAAREKEISVRLALGVGRGRLIRQLFAESLVLALIAGLFGLALALVLVRLVGSFSPPGDFPFELDLALNLRVLGFTFVAALVTGVLFGLAPAFSAARLDFSEVLREGASSTGTRISRVRQVLVIGQLALSLMLLVGAGLAMRGLDNARKLDVGFDPDNQIVGVLDLGLQGYDEAKAKEFRRAIRERVESWPDVQAMGFAEVIPMHLTSQQNGAVPDGFEVPDGKDNPSIDYNVVDHTYFEAMGIPILRGRSFTEMDDSESTSVLIVNQAFVDRFWPGEDPIGKHVRTRGDDHEVVGMVPTGKYFSIGEDPKPYMYYSFEQFYRGTSVIHIRTEGNPAQRFAALRNEVRQLDETLPVSDLETMHSALGLALLPARMAAGVVSAFAVLALLLASVGLYGVIAYSVNQRTREFGIRMALGAQAADVLRLVVRRASTVTVIGLGVGLVGGALLAMGMSKVLYGVDAFDLVAYGSASIALAIVALAATLWPASRAARVSPVEALTRLSQ